MKSCIPVIPSVDLEKSLRFWVDGLGLILDREMRIEGRLVGCMVHNEHLFFWLNQKGSEMSKDYQGINLYWTPSDIHATREHLKQLGYKVSDIEERDYGQTEFFTSDNDGYTHCFGIATKL